MRYFDSGFQDFKRMPDSLLTLCSLVASRHPTAVETLPLFHDENPDWRRYCSRELLPAHFTVSVRVWQDSGNALVIRHPKLGIPTYPGGHIEAGETMAEAACRELMEEAGLLAESDSLQIVGMGLHPISAPREPTHWHLDVLFSVHERAILSQTSPLEQLEINWTDDLSLYNQYCRL